jgi:hypothetical protein
MEPTETKNETGLKEVPTVATSSATIKIGVVKNDEDIARAMQLHAISPTLDNAVHDGETKDSFKKLIVCFSYCTKNIERVREAKEGLESLGHQVKSGFDMEQTSATDWRTMWIAMCDEADFVINFLSSDYAQSGACIEEWNYAKAEKNPNQVYNVTLGGGECRKEIMNLKDAGRLAQGSGALVMYFPSGFQAVSVYDTDNIVEKIVQACNLCGGSHSSHSGKTKSNPAVGIARNGPAWNDDCRGNVQWEE